MHNAVVQAQHEIAVRYDFKGTRAAIEYNKKDNTLTLTADHKGQLDTVIQMLKEKMAKRGVAVNALKRGKMEEATHDSVRETLTLHIGVETDDAREDRQANQADGNQGSGADHGQQGAGDWQEDRRAPGRDRPLQGARAGISAPVRQLHLSRAIGATRAVASRRFRRLETRGGGVR